MTPSTPTPAPGNGRPPIYFFDPLALPRHDAIMTQAPVDLANNAYAHLTIDCALIAYADASADRPDADPVALFREIIAKAVDHGDPDLSPTSPDVRRAHLEIQRSGYGWVGALLLAFERFRMAVTSDPGAFLRSRFCLVPHNASDTDAELLGQARVALRYDPMMRALPMVFRDAVQFERINSTARAILVRAAASLMPQASPMLLNPVLHAALGDDSSRVRRAAVEELSKHDRLDEATIRVIAYQAKVDPIDEIRIALLDLIRKQPENASAPAAKVEHTVPTPAYVDAPPSALPMLYTTVHACDCGYVWRLVIDFRGVADVSRDEGKLPLYNAWLYRGEEQAVMSTPDRSGSSAVIWAGSIVDGMLAVRDGATSIEIPSATVARLAAQVHVQAATAIGCLDVLRWPEALKHGAHVNTMARELNEDAMRVEVEMSKLVRCGLAHESGVGVYRIGPSPARRVRDHIGASSTTSPLYRIVDGLAEHGRVAVSPAGDWAMVREFIAAITVAWLEGCGSSTRRVWIIVPPQINNGPLRETIEAGIASYFDGLKVRWDRFEQVAGARATWETLGGKRFEIVFVLGESDTVMHMLAMSDPSDLWCTYETFPQDWLRSDIAQLIEENALSLRTSLARVGIDMKPLHDTVKRYTIARSR